MGIFKAYDIRGVYPDPLDEAKAWSIGYGCATYLLREAQAAGERTPMMKHIVVGRDMRKSSPSLRDALCQGIIDVLGVVRSVWILLGPGSSVARRRVGVGR